MRLNLISYRDLIKTIAHLDDSPHKIALSFAVGVYIAASPFFGIHTILAIVLSIIFGLNKLATITGSWVNMPWTAPIIYYIEYRIGAFFLGKDPHFNLKPFTIQHYLESGKNAFLSIFIGSIIVGIILSIIFYFIIKYLVELYRRRKHVSTKG